MKQKKKPPTKYTQKEPRQQFEKFSSKWSPGATPRTLVVSKQHIRQTEQYTSLSTPGGSTPYQESPKYTGDAVKGISLVHKSGFAPVFSDEQTKEFAAMRR